MEWKYGIQMDGVLLEKYDTPEEAYEAGQFGYEESGVFHEVVLVHPNRKTINEM